MLGSFSNCNVFQFKNKTIPSGDFDVFHKLVIDGTSLYMVSLVIIGKYGAINAADPMTMEYYVVKYVSYDFKWQEYLTKDGQVGRSGELIVLL